MSLVEMSLNDRELERYSRHFVLADVGKEGQLRLKQGKVAIVGVGGLGNYSAQLLALLGVGYIRVIDRDVVEENNLHRTPLFEEKDIDLPKAEVAATKLQKLNPYIKVEAYTTDIGLETVETALSGVDLIIDGLDNFKARAALNRYSLKYKIPLIFGGALSWSGNVSVFNYKEEDPCLECLYGEVDDSQLPTCETMGVHASILSQVASLQVAAATRILLGKEPLLRQKLLFIDLRRMTFDKITVLKNENCTVCNIGETQKSRLLPTISHKKSTYSDTEHIYELCGSQSFAVRQKFPIDIDIDRIGELLTNKNDYKFKKLGKTAVMISFPENVKVTIFRSGNMLIRGVNTKDDVRLLLNKLSPLLEKTIN